MFVQQAKHPAEEFPERKDLIISCISLAEPLCHDITVRLLEDRGSYPPEIHVGSIGSLSKITQDWDILSASSTANNYRTLRLYAAAKNRGVECVIIILRLKNNAFTWQKVNVNAKYNVVKDTWNGEFE